MASTSQPVFHLTLDPPVIGPGGVASAGGKAPTSPVHTAGKHAGAGDPAAARDGSGYFGIEGGVLFPRSQDGVFTTTFTQTAQSPAAGSVQTPTELNGALGLPGMGRQVSSVPPVKSVGSHNPWPEFWTAVHG